MTKPLFTPAHGGRFTYHGVDPMFLTSALGHKWAANHRLRWARSPNLCAEKMPPIAEQKPPKCTEPSSRSSTIDTSGQRGHKRGSVATLYEPLTPPTGDRPGGCSIAPNTVRNRVERGESG